jgi:hypothetical protein
MRIDDNSDKLEEIDELDRNTHPIANMVSCLNQIRELDISIGSKTGEDLTKRSLTAMRSLCDILAMSAVRVIGRIDDGSYTAISDPGDSQVKRMTVVHNCRACGTQNEINISSLRNRSQD